MLAAAQDSQHRDGFEPLAFAFFLWRHVFPPSLAPSSCVPEGRQGLPRGRGFLPSRAVGWDPRAVLCFVQADTYQSRLQYNTLHDEILPDRFYALNILPSAKKLRRIDAITELRTRTVARQITRILLLCTTLFTTCILDLFTVYKDTLKFFI